MAEKQGFTYQFDSRKKKEIDAILSRYSAFPATSANSTNYQKIKELDRKVEQPATVVFAIMLTVGILIFGTGLSVVLVAFRPVTGSIIGLAGTGVMILSFKAREIIGKRRRRLFEKTMLDLAAEDGI